MTPGRAPSGQAPSLVHAVLRNRCLAPGQVRPGPVILGIETSCDETAAALVTRGRRARSPTSSRRRPSCTRATAASCRRSPRGATSSSSRPSCARRSSEAGATLDEVDRVAVTQGPGLIGALLVGLAAAKAIAWSRRLPLVPVDHLHGHVASLYLRPDAARAAVPLPARQRRAHAAARRARHGDAARARHDARRRRRRGVRQGRAAARARLPRRRAIDRLAREGDPAASPSRSRASRASTSRSRASRPRSSTRRASSRPAELEARRADLAALVPAGDRPGARRPRARGRGSRSARRGSPSSAASPPTPSCARRSPTPRSRRSRSAPTTRR